MNKEFVPYEQALALKELGFNEPCLGYYRIFSDGDIKLLVNSNSNMRHLEAPTFSQAFRFFREKYNLYHNINPLTFQKLEEEPIYKIRGYTCEIKWINSCYTIGRYDSYEEAELACLKKLIEIVKNKKD